jgi:hypothetical protein
MPAAPVLFHSTAYPDSILLHGLQPRPNRTRAHRLFKEHPDPAVAARAAHHEGNFIFASPDAFVAQVYAFKVNGSFAEGMHRTVLFTTEERELIMVLVVGRADAYREALAKTRPTYFTIADPSVFEPVFYPDGTEAREWISRTAIAADALEARAVSFDELQGKVEFFEFEPDLAAFPSRIPKQIFGMETLAMMKEGIIVPANHRLGLRPVLAEHREPTRAAALPRYAGLRRGRLNP